MALKIVLDFVEDIDGWSEVYYTGSSDPSSYIQFTNAGTLSTLSPAGILCNARASLLNKTSRIAALRASVVGTPQTTLSAIVPANLGQGDFPPLGANPGPTGSAEIFSRLLVRMVVGTTKRKSLFMGGVPEQIIGENDAYSPTARWNTIFRTFINLIIGTPYGIVGRQTPTTVPAAVPITAFTTDVVGQSATLSPFVAPAGPPASWYVIIRGMKYPRGWNGIHRATVNPANNTSIILGPTRRSMITLPAWAIGAGGTVQVLNPPFNAITRVAPEYITHRKTGRPFGSLRGRRP